LHYEIKSRRYDNLIKFKDNTILALIDLYLKLPESFQPEFISYQIDRYSKKQIDKLQSQIIKGKWNVMSLEKVVEDIKERRVEYE
jgi:hypothetical protein